MLYPQNEFYIEIVKIIQSDNLPDILGWMAVHSQSLILNYGEDNRLWECSWIITGPRVTSVDDTPLKAIKSVLNTVRTEILTNNNFFTHKGASTK